MSYIKQALRTEFMDFTPIKNRLSDIGTLRLLHGVMGISTEAAELEDVMKKHIFYGKEVDTVNLKEENL